MIVVNMPPLEKGAGVGLDGTVARPGRDRATRQLTGRKGVFQTPGIGGHARDRALSLTSGRSDMSGSVNKVILIGNLGRDPEIRTFQNGGKVANFSVATSERWTDRASGEKREKTEWHNVVVRNENLVGVCERFLRKGAKVYLEGRIETRKYTDQSGQERFITEIVLPPFRGELTMLDGRGEGRGGDMGSGPGGYGADPGYDSPPRGGGRDRGGPGGPSGGARGGPGDLDDEIPF